MAEIRQIQVDGVNYDLVISEDEVSATAAAQSAAQALAYKNQAQTSAAQAQTQATNASNQADRAEDAASRAEQIVGGEFLSYGGDQGLNEDEKEQARKNAVVGKNNYNLLDNAWWGSGEVVNQRGVSTFTTGAYNIDRWYFYKSATASAAALSADGVAFTYASGDMQLAQSMRSSVYDYIAGKTVTVSILLSNGTIVSGTGTAPSSGLVTIIQRDTGFMGMIDGTNRTVYIRSYQNATIRAVKLEIGTYSTLGNDTPPDYGIELARCIYATAGSSDIYANNGFGRSNRNLLDNPWFTVNQRSAGSTSDGYPADRWLKVGNTAATATATANGLVIALNGSGYCDLRNRYSEAEIITPNLGKTATISIMLADGTVFSDQIVLNTTQQNRYLNSGKIRFDLSVSGGVYLMRLVLYDDMTIRAVKLELGSVSTLANDAPPNYAEELAKCQYYFRRVQGDIYLCSGMVINATSVVFPFPFTMYKNPVVTISGNIVAASTGGLITMTAVQSVGRATNAIQVRFTTSGATAYSAALLTPQNGGYIDFSADL